MINRPLVIFLMGPTASGKTSVAMALQKQENKIKIISVDSALVYKGMDIGTSKPSPSELKYAPHKLIDIRDPAESYSVSNFYYDAIYEIRKIINSGSIPLLVGGTMLYFKVLLQGLFNVPKNNQKIRNTLQYEVQRIGWMNMYNKLRDIDPVVSNIIHPNDHRRIIRALEIFLISGKTWTELKNEVVINQKLQCNYRVLQFAIMPSSRKILNDRIKDRFYFMLESGFENEVITLFNRSDLHSRSISSISCIGYRQMWDYLSGKIKYNDMICQGIYASQRLVKKQLTWLRSWSDLYWLNNDHISDLVDGILQILSKNVY